MVHYIQTLIEHLITHFRSSRTGGLESRIATLADELERLGPLEFEPSYRFEFLNLRRLIKGYVRLDENTEWPELKRCLAKVNGNVGFGTMAPTLDRIDLLDDCLHLFIDNHTARSTLGLVVADYTIRRLESLSRVLDHYLGLDVRVKARDFSYIRNVELRQIVERDYNDLMLRLFPMQTWKSVVIIAGSILEALLHDLMTRDEARISLAMKCGRAPTVTNGARRGRKRDLKINDKENQWLLNDYIEVADDLALLPTGWKISVQAVLRDFRNYVHPRKEIGASDKITDGEAFQSVGCLMRICDHMQRVHP